MFAVSSSLSSHVKRTVGKDTGHWSEESREGGTISWNAAGGGGGKEMTLVVDAF